MCLILSDPRVLGQWLRSLDSVACLAGMLHVVTTMLTHLSVTPARLPACLSAPCLHSPVSGHAAG